MLIPDHTVSRHSTLHCHVSKLAESYPLFKTNKIKIKSLEAIDYPSVTTDGDFRILRLSNEDLGASIIKCHRPNRSNSLTAVELLSLPVSQFGGNKNIAQMGL